MIILVGTAGFEPATICSQRGSQDSGQPVENPQISGSGTESRRYSVYEISGNSPAGQATGRVLVARPESRVYRDAPDSTGKFDEVYIVAKARRYEDEAEISWGIRYPHSRKRGASLRGSSQNLQSHRYRSNIRAGAVVRRKILSAGLDHLLTLTTRENITDLDRSAEQLVEFVRMVHEYIPEWAYVAVAEKQKRGAYHWHIAVKGWQNISLLRNLWQESCGAGNIDVRAPKGQTGNSQWQKIKLALYLSKYISKTFDVSQEGNILLGRHRYRASLGIEDNVEVRIFPVAAGETAVVSWLVEIAGRVGFMKTFEEGKAGWMCSWSFI